MRPPPRQVGNDGLTLAQQRSHFALWALLKSPLMIGADLRAISKESLAILKNREVLQVGWPVPVLCYNFRNAKRR